MRRRAFICALLLLLGSVQAARIEIQPNLDDPNRRFEIRNITLPDGTSSELFIIKNIGVRVIIDETDEIIANHIEFDRSNKLLRIIGFGTFRSETETVQGEDLVIELGDASFQGQDVLIITEAIDVIGADASRAPGQLSVLSGRFSPCSRCNQQTEDYAFRAERIELFPGDRLVAYQVTVLVRDNPVFYLPLLVLPLAPPDRSPRLSISQGTADERAEVALDWPYVAGANALGTFSIRYYADVLPGQGNFFTNGLLGGGVVVNYLGGGFNHLFYTGVGSGSVDFFYRPSFVEYADPEAKLEPSGKTRDEFTVRFRYDTAADLDIPHINLLYERDDSEKQRLSEYRVGLSNIYRGVTISFTSQGFLDHDVTDDVIDPSYDGPGTPHRTPLRLEFRPEEEAVFSVGPFRLSNLLIDLGVFQDQPDRSNRSAAGGRLVATGRLLEQHDLALEPVPFWPGLELSGRSSFRGQYYGTGERLVDWQTSLRLNQDLGVGSLSFDFTRNIIEGETPFRFDGPRTGLGRNVFLVSALNLEPLPWLSFSSRETYTFTNDRNIEEEGFGPLENRLSLFDNLNWISLSFEETYDIKERDPGNLTTTLSLNAPSRDFEAEADLSYIYDLKPNADRRSDGPDNDTEFSLRYRFGIDPLVTLELSAGYQPEPPLPLEPFEPRDFYKPLELDLLFGTSDQQDRIPGLSVSYERNLNTREAEALSLELSQAFQPFEFRLEQSVDYDRARSQRRRKDTNPEAPIETLGEVPWESAFTVSWNGVTELELKNLLYLPARTLGIDVVPDAERPYSVSLRDDLENSDVEWRLTYRSTYDPVLSVEDGLALSGNKNTRFEAFATVTAVRLAGLRFGVDFKFSLLLEDDLRDISYVDDSSLDLFLDIYGVVGLYGALRYLEAPGSLDGEPFIAQQRLVFDDFGLTVKFFDQLYLSAILNDTWDLVGENPAESPYNFQPEFRVLWDRCCWLLLGSWDTATGQISITLTTPGASQGFEQDFLTDLRLPGRGTDPTP